MSYWLNQTIEPTSGASPQLPVCIASKFRTAVKQKKLKQRRYFCLVCCYSCTVFCSD